MNKKEKNLNREFITINPRVDLVFKKTFGVDENKDLLISLINSIVDEKDQVKDLTIKNPYNNKNFKADKLSILDIKAQGIDGKLFNIEMQITDEANYDKRALYYWARAYTSQIGHSASYSELKKTLGIHILNFLSIPESPKYHNVFKIIERELNIEKFDDIELHTIELSKFDKDSDSDITKILSKIKTKLDKWATFFTHPEVLLSEQVPDNLNDDDLKKAAHVVNVMSLSKEERSIYEDRLDWFRLEEDALSKRFKDGVQEGFDKGKEEGKIEIAKNLISMNMSVEQIVKATGLSIDEINSLK